MSIVDLQAVKKWNQIPKEMQNKLIDNVFCGKCGVTTITDYTMTNDKYGVLLEGKCKKCGGPVARLIED
ncbi:hypothetical protein C4565_08920 [Candidatus Parcubacteria bacterium]|jgi:hypothetical protein|nr:MAG: hypothetical protein C4565_08920 [Candidatus Parcubacteria bacterium]